MTTLRPQSPQEIFPYSPETAQVLQELIATQPEVVVHYPERPRTPLPGVQPAFAAKGIDLQDPDARQRGLAVFEDSARFGTETQLIVTGTQDGEKQTLVLKRHMGSNRDEDKPDYTVVQSFAFFGTAAAKDHSAKGRQHFYPKGVTLSPDGKSLHFDRKDAEPGDMTSFDMDGMYLVPSIHPERNYDQVKGAKLGRLFPRLSSKARRQIFLD
ncbi:MAG TPA: hypothetical protein VLF62_04590 [Candidatus Saccharimonadales bacterium]|nr:hypothetical protein [Candidatus Saccharimonadales bacterium]